MGSKKHLPLENKMTIIAPSILSADFMNLGQELKALEQNSDLWIHLDIMDGHFVPNLTFGATVLKNIKKYTPYPLDAHFMVENPEDYIESFRDLGVHNFTFHWESVRHHDSLIAKIQNSFDSCGISLNPSTPITVIPDYLLAKIDLILIMSVNPGFGGQSFISGTINKIRELNQIRKDKNLNFQIQVDGGVSENNAPELISAGANNLVAGSFIFNESSDKYKNQIQRLR